MPRFSVILPLYNKEPYVVRTLESVSRQTFRGFEAIIIDDGSTDNSAEVVEQYLAGLPDRRQFRMVRQEDMGVSQARNRGVELSTGEYVTFLDCDDWWEPTFLEEMDGLIRRYPQAGIYGTGYYIVKHGQRRKAPIGVDDTFSDGIIDYCNVYARTLCMPLTSDTVAMRREVFEASSGFRTGITLGEDFDLWLRIALSHPVAFLNKPLANYFQDLPSSVRAIGRLHIPQEHMLWNLDYLADEERRNESLKNLLDRLRIYNLLPYYLSHQYHGEALDELKKVDWQQQPSTARRPYTMPLAMARFQYRARRIGASVKKNLKRKK